MSDNNKDGGCGCLIILAIIIILTRGAAVPIIILLVLFFMAVGLISSLKDKLFKSGNSGSSSETWNNSYGDNRNSSYGDNRNSSSSGRSSEHHETEYIEFISAVCRICGYISRAGGAITKEQIDLVSRLIDTSEVPLRVKSRLQKDFNTGKSENFDPYDTCRSIRNEFSDPDLQNFILNVLLSLIYSDNVVTELELQRLYQVTDLVSISTDARKEAIQVQETPADTQAEVHRIPADIRVEEVHQIPADIQEEVVHPLRELTAVPMLCVFLDFQTVHLQRKSSVHT